MNKLTAHITAIEKSGQLTLVTLDYQGQRLRSINITTHHEQQLKVGNEITILFKESEVSIGKDVKGKISLQNIIQSKIVAIHSGQLLSSVRLDCGGKLIESIITTHAVKNLNLEIGNQVNALIKTTEMILSND